MKDEVQGKGVPMTSQFVHPTVEALAIAVEEAESDEDGEFPPPPDDFQSAESDIEDSAEPDRYKTKTIQSYRYRTMAIETRITPSVIKIDIDPSADGSAEENVQLLAYRMAPNPSDLSPSRQRRHLNGNAPSQ